MASHDATAVVDVVAPTSAAAGRSALRADLDGRHGDHWFAEYLR